MDKNPVEEVKQWLEKAVIGLQLCPFAKAPFRKRQVRFTLADTAMEEDVIHRIIHECQILDKDLSIETTLIICTDSLRDFFDYCQFLQQANQVLKRNGWRGIYQIASFHPDYEFLGTHRDDLQNLTNRSPWPILHLLREESLSAVLQDYPDANSITEKNVRTLEALAPEEVKKIFWYLWK